MKPVVKWFESEIRVEIKISPNWSHYMAKSSGVYAVVTTTIRLRFDRHATAYQRSLRSQWRNPLATVTLTFINYLGHTAASHSQLGLYGRNVGRRMDVARSNRSCNRRLTNTCFSLSGRLSTELVSKFLTASDDKTSLVPILTLKIF